MIIIGMPAEQQQHRRYNTDDKAKGLIRGRGTMKYKVGDKVKITTGEHSKVWHWSMTFMEGLTATIIAVDEVCYQLADGWFVEDKDIEGLVE